MLTNLPSFYGCEIGIAEHLRGFEKDGVRVAIALLSRDDEAELLVVVDGLEQVMRMAHSLCLGGKDFMLTWPRQVTLS